jgi:hypothetical protein
MTLETSGSSPDPAKELIKQISEEGLAAADKAIKIIDRVRKGRSDTALIDKLWEKGTTTIKK